MRRFFVDLFSWLYLSYITWVAMKLISNIRGQFISLVYTNIAHLKTMFLLTLHRDGFI
jgi:hypothetical protein